jgi:hypothetical protein
LLAFGFVKQQGAYILKNFNLDRVVDVTNYYGWLIKNKPSKDYSQKYFYYLLNNFQFDKTWADYQSYYNKKKNTASLDLPKKKSYILSGKKLGKDKKLDTKPKNIIDFIKNGSKSKD